jgi:ABC-type branched-subunit amino acid transport system ATPase component
MMIEPRVLLVDEPTQFLAPRATSRVLAILRDLAHEQGLAVLMAETSVAAAARSADRAYVLNSGRIRSEHRGVDLLKAGPASWWRLL